MIEKSMSIEEVQSLAEAGFIDAYKFNPQTGYFDVEWRGTPRDRNCPCVLQMIDGTVIRHQR